MNHGQEKPAVKKVVTRYNALNNTLAQKPSEQILKEQQQKDLQKKIDTTMEQKSESVEISRKEIERNKKIAEHKKLTEKMLSKITYRPLEGVVQQVNTEPEQVVVKKPTNVKAPMGPLRYSPLLNELEQEKIEKEAQEKKNEKPWYKFW